MKAPKTKTLAAMLVLSCALMSRPVIGGIDDDLRRAAALHRGGETPAAMKIWRHWADRDDVDAAYNLAVIHHHGDGVARDDAQALKWYKFAAERDDAVAQYQVGLMYLNGQGVAADEQEAHRWFTLRRQHHAHHANSPQMLAWRAQAAAMIQDRDRRESLLAARGESERVMADLRRRAGLTSPLLASTAGPATN